jgi:hypothetical protein
MLRCIICKSEHTFKMDLTQRYVLRKGLIKYNKTNGIMMRSQVPC